jgi:O-acetyl-ADP-ribose deacetylase (regulator of RNase III)
METAPSKKEESHPTTTTNKQQQQQPPGTTNGRNGQANVNRGMTFTKLPPPQTNFDRLTVFQSGPIVHFNRDTSLHHSVPLHDFDHETAVLKYSLQEAEKMEATRSIELEVEPGHPDRLRAFFEMGTGRVLHLSCYGHPDHLAFENGAGYIQTMAVEELRNLIQSGKCPLQLVVVNSFHSGRIGKAFLEAGVPHVICCHHTEVFRDTASSHFVKNLYRGLASNKSLKQAFYMAQEAVRVEEISKHIDRYVLLPRKAEDDPYHDVPIFFTESVPPMGIREDDGDEPVQDVIPRLPKHFIGREVDMYEVLEALRVDDVVRVGGSKGSGKTSLVAAVCRYISMRRKTFNYDDVFWLPAAQGVVPEEDTLFADLCDLADKMLNADEHFAENEEAMETSERIQIELEGRRTLLAIDGRKFKTEASSQSLETFIGDLLNAEVDVKIILITNHGEDVEIEEEGDTINLGPIDFKATALLFGEISRFITANGCPAAQSPDEFAALMVPPSVAKLQDQTKFASSRRTELLNLIGDGNPLRVIKAGKHMPASTFIQLIGMANTPEVRVDSYKGLLGAIEKWTTLRDEAVVLKNYLRAADLDKVLAELEDLRPQFPSIEVLQNREAGLQRKLTQAMAQKNYTAGNGIKREILGMKKVIMQEKRASSASREISAATRMMDLQNQMQHIMKLAHSSFTDLDALAPADVTSGTFSLGSVYHNCEVSIYPGSVVQFSPGNDLGGSICWTNECCDLKQYEGGRVMTEWGGPNLAKDILTLPGITKTRFGMAKCGTGNAVIVGPGNYDDLQVHCVILAVGPLSPACDEECEADDEDALHYIKIMMRSCIRSSLILAKHSQVQSIAFPTLTTKMGSPTYEQTLLMGLKIMVEEAKHSDLNTLHIVASSEEESSKLIAMAMEMGLVLT